MEEKKRERDREKKRVSIILAVCFYSQERDDFWEKSIPLRVDPQHTLYLSATFSNRFERRKLSKDIKFMQKNILKFLKETQEASW